MFEIFEVDVITHVRQAAKQRGTHPAVDGSKASREVTNESSRVRKLCTRIPCFISLRWPVPVLWDRVVAHLGFQFPGLGKVWGHVNQSTSRP